MRFLVLMTATVFVGAGCAPVKFEMPTRLAQVPGQVLSDKQVETIEPGMMVMRISSGTSTRGNLVLVGFDQRRFRFGLAATGTRLNMEDWERVLPASVAAINGVYFRDDLSPAGFFVASGTRQTNRRFDTDASALIVLREHLEIIDTSRIKVGWHFLEQGAQTYPVLVRNGRAAVARETGKLARRSWVGTDKQGWVWLGVLAQDQLSLYQIAQRLVEFKVDW
jgi:hypothetical protein